MRIIIVSNRLPVTLQEHKGRLKIVKSSGGLVSGLESVLPVLGKIFPKSTYLWVGWPGNGLPAAGTENIRARLRARRLYPVNLSNAEAENFYGGFCNDTIWPLFHYFPSYVSYHNEQWSAYRQINERFAAALLEIARPGDIFWIHDYHLMLLPKLLRDKLPNAAIGFFLHIPFPFFEVFRLLPNKWRRHLLQGLLGADLIGFHTYDYARYFLDSAERILGAEHTLGTLLVNNCAVKADAFPLGIDFEKFNNAAVLAPVAAEQKKLKKIIGERKIILSIDRLDYTKGILKRLEAYQQFLEKNSHWRGRVSYFVVVVPSRIEVERYQAMKRQIDEIIGKINGAYGTLHWTPIIYQFKSVTFAELIALYSLSDVALVTPLRDGMNLVAKEYLAARRDKTGMLILSEMAGAAQELGEALIINPHHVEEIVEALETALRIPRRVQQDNNEIMQSRLRRYTVHRWAEDFLKELVAFKETSAQKFATKLIGAYTRGQIHKEFADAGRRLLLLDYDGTLVPFAKTPTLAVPDKELLALLRRLAELRKTDTVLISGRDRDTLDRWFRGIPLYLVAEHGMWIKEPKGRWHQLKPLQNAWKAEVLPILRRFADRIPGALVEEKEFSIAWHYRAADPELGSLYAKELVSTLTDFTANRDLQVLQGNKVVEIRNAGIDKGSTALYFIEQKKYDCMLALGDDATDEDLFKALPDTAYTIKVGGGASLARYAIESPPAARQLLQQLTED